jgi:hypothetical protein
MGLLLVALAHAAAPVTVESAMEQAAALSPAEAAQFGDAAIAEIATGVATVEKLLEAARKQGDAEAVECLTRKHAAMKALHGIAATSRAALAASAHPDGELRKVAVALSRARAFLAEAHACVAEASAEAGEARVSVTGTPADGPALADLADVGPRDELPCIEVVWTDGTASAASGLGGSDGATTKRVCF